MWTLTVSSSVLPRKIGSCSVIDDGVRVRLEMGRDGVLYKSSGKYETETLYLYFYVVKLLSESQDFLVDRIR